MSEPLTITFKFAREHNACRESYRRMAKAVGGIKHYGATTPVPLEQVLDVLGPGDVDWALEELGLQDHRDGKSCPVCAIGAAARAAKMADPSIDQHQWEATRLREYLRGEGVPGVTA